MCSIMSSGKNRRIFSAIRPSASMPHLGNYIGMIRPILDLQNAAAANNDSLFVCIADLHALTGAANLKSVENLRKSRRQMAAALLACGIDTKTTSLFYQSDVILFFSFSFHSGPYLFLFLTYNTLCICFKILQCLFIYLLL
ncbi:MAG: Tryptophan--tRNA ligase, mitochondrial [Marteilia pararefringens]